MSSTECIINIDITIPSELLSESEFTNLLYGFGVGFLSSGLWLTVDINDVGGNSDKSIQEQFGNLFYYLGISSLET
jgi:hypothetical protein